MTSEPAIISRFFEAFDYILQSKKVSGLAEFCKLGGLDRSHYQRLRKGTGRYSKIHASALAFMVSKYKISAEWLLTGSGEMAEYKFRKPQECSNTP